MPKFARPNSYTGKQSNQQWTGDARAATNAEMLAGLSSQVYISPKTLDAAVGTLIPPASETVAGIAELATQAETNTGTDDARIVTPLKLKTNLTTPPAIGATTPNTVNSTVLSAQTRFEVNGGAVTDSIGTGTLTLGAATILNTNIAATDRIFLQRTEVNASTTLGEFTYTISAATSFTVTSVILGTPGSPQTGDVSSFTYLIVRQV